MKPECLAARRAVVLGDSGSASVRDHLGACNECREFETSERTVARLVRDRAARPVASHALRERLVVALDLERRRAQRQGLQRWFGWTAALAALLILGAGSAWLHFRHQGHVEARRTVAALAADHITYAARDDRAQILSNSPQQVADWLRGRTRLAVSLPFLPGAALIGARRCSVHGRPAALAFYLMGTAGGGGWSPASLFTFETGSEDWSHMETLPSAHSRRICRAKDRGLTVLIWEDRGLTYAFVTEVPEADLAALASPL